MDESIHIRRYKEGEETILFDIYYSAIHLVASRDYTVEQIQAWAPQELNAARWRERIRGINPFVAELDRELVGYADVQSDGYIDHFFVSGRHPRKGIGTQLMKRIFEEAATLGVASLSSDVSRTAQPFFAKFGFVVVEQRRPVIRDVVIPNALMRCDLK